MNIKESRYITSMELRRLCIQYDWYTCGTNEEYAHLFKLADKENLTTGDLVEIATDIIAHSEPDENLTIPYVCFELLDAIIAADEWETTAWELLDDIDDCIANERVVRRG